MSRKFDCKQRAADVVYVFFFFNAPAPTGIYPLPLHGALPICPGRPSILGCQTGPPPLSLSLSRSLFPLPPPAPFYQPTHHHLTLEDNGLTRHYPEPPGPCHPCPSGALHTGSRHRSHNAWHVRRCREAMTEHCSEHRTEWEGASMELPVVTVD